MDRESQKTTVSHLAAFAAGVAVAAFAMPNPDSEKSEGVAPHTLTSDTIVEFPPQIAENEINQEVEGVREEVQNSFVGGDVLFSTQGLEKCSRTELEERLREIQDKRAQLSQDIVFSRVDFKKNEIKRAEVAEGEIRNRLGRAE